VRSTVEALEGNKVKLSVEVDEAEFDIAIGEAFKRIAREVRIPGFRPGKAPRRILESRLGPEVGRQEALREALPEYYARAVGEHEVDVIAAPEIDITAGQEDGPVSFDAVRGSRSPATAASASRCRAPRSPTTRSTPRSTASAASSASWPTSSARPPRATR
jgi:trigger factor